MPDTGVLLRWVLPSCFRTAWCLRTACDNDMPCRYARRVGTANRHLLTLGHLWIEIAIQRENALALEQL
jgi:hypothetical protein